MIAEHGGFTVSDENTPGFPIIAGAQLPSVTPDWNIQFPIAWPHTVPAERFVVGIVPGTSGDPSFPRVLGENFSFVHAAINPDTTSLDVSIPAPLLGAAGVPDGVYTLFVTELPETKFVCEDVEPFDCFEEPYTDQDFINFIATDSSQPDAPFTYPPLSSRSVAFHYVAGEAPVSCASDCFSSVVFLPGIKGSVLKSGSDTLWPPTVFSNDIPQLALNDAGESVNDVQVDGVLNNFCVVAFCTPVYAPFSTFMDGLVQDGVINDWLPLAYDWRFMPETILADGIKTPDGTIDILQKIEDLAAHSKSGKVTIVAHSMGGLMGKAIIKRLQQEGKDDLIDSFVMVGSPQLGTPQAVSALLHGDGEGIVGAFVVDPAKARTLAQNMPSAYNLLPSAAYFATVTDPVITFDDVGFTQAWRNLWGNSINSYGPFVQFLTGQGVARTHPAESALQIPEVLQSDLVGAATDFHATYDTYQFPAHIRVVQVAGWGRPTVKAVKYTTHHFLQSYDTPFTREGDNTVVYPSAISSSADETYFFDIFAQNKALGENTQHRDLLSADPVKNVVRLVVKGENVLGVNYISTIKPALTNLDDELVISTHSPVILGAYDAFGHFTGIDQNQNLSAEILKIQEGIPGSSFVYTSDSQHIFLPKNGTYTFVYKGTGDGPTTVNVDTFSADAVAPVAQFSDIPTTGNTTASFVVASTAPEDTTIAVDVDGDTHVDQTVPPDGTLPSLSDLITLIKQKIGSLSIASKLEQNLLKKIESLEKKIAAKRQQNAKILANLKAKISKQGMKGKIATGDANAITALIEQLEAQAEDVTLDVDILAQLKNKVVSLNIKASLKNDLLKRVTKLENEQALTNSLANLTKTIQKKATNGKIADADAQMLIDLLGQIENAI